MSSLDEFRRYLGLPAGLPYWLMFLLVLILNGYGEELGWRGFATHKLMLTIGKFRATLVVTGKWMVWHIGGVTRCKDSNTIIMNG